MDPRAWIVAGGVAWIAIAAALFPRILPADPRTLNRASGARCLLGALLGVAILALVSWSTSDFPLWPRAAVTLVIYLGLVGFLLAFAEYVDPGSEILGLDRRTAFSDLSRGIVTYIAFIPVVIAAHVLNTYFVQDSAENVQRSLRELQNHEGLPRILLGVTLVCAVPVFEEILFRGLLQQGIKAQLALAASPRQAAIFSILLASVGFTALHETPTYVPVFALALILGSSFERSGRILVPVGLHAAHNLAVILLQSVPHPWGGGP